MSFFDGDPSAAPVPLWSQHPWDPPEAGFPGVVPFTTLILAQTARAAGPLNIGVIQPFSGAMAIYGDEVARCYGIAADDVNAKGGVLGRQVQVQSGRDLE